MQLRLALIVTGSQSWPFYLHLLGAGITGMQQQDCDQELLKASLSLQSGGIAQWSSTVLA